MNARSLLLLLATSLLLPLVAFGQTTKNDDALIAEMNRRVKELQIEAQRSADDFGRLTRLQEEVMAVVRDTIAKVSPKTRPSLEIGLLLLGPLQQESAAYMKFAEEKIGGGLFDFTTLRDRTEIAARIETLREIKNRNERLRAQLERMNAEVERILAASSLSKAEQRAFTDGFNKGFGRTAGPMKAVRTLDSELFDRFVAAFELLEQHWGAWAPTEAGPFTWSNEKAEQKFVALVEDIQVLAERQQEAQRVLTERIAQAN